MMSLRRKTMIKWMSRMTTKLSTKLPWHKRQRIHMFRVSGTVRKGSKTVIYRHHFLFRCSLLINCSVTVLSSSSLQIEWNVPQFVTSVIFVLASYLSQFIKITVGETFLWKDFLSALCFKCFCSRDRNIFRVRPSRNYAPNLPYSYTKSTQNPSGQMYPGL